MCTYMIDASEPTPPHSFTGGSTGYGREYRNRLLGNWGIVDVDDCANAAAHLARQGLVDPKKLCIDGGSAGGYTTLACLAFRCGCVQ